MSNYTVYQNPHHLPPLTRPGLAKRPTDTEPVIVYMPMSLTEPKHRTTAEDIAVADAIITAGVSLVLATLIMLLICVGPLIALNIWLFKGAL